MTGPVWDGDGVDPWLPARLQAQAGLAAAERSVYDDWLARLTGWLARVARAVLRAGIPDPNGVWGLAPAWAQEMADFTNRTVKAVMGAAYEALLGPGYRFDSRPFVAAYLAQVTNRMLATPDEVFDLVVGEVAEGAGLGESIPKITARIDTVLSATDTPRWPHRAVVVARTETISAMNAGRYDAFSAVAAELAEDDPADEGFEDMWLATDDARTRPSHRAADGQRVPLGTPFTVGGASLLFPGQPGAPAQEVIQCRCTHLLVRPGEELDYSGRQFRSD